MLGKSSFSPGESSSGESSKRLVTTKITAVKELCQRIFVESASTMIVIMEEKIMIYLTFPFHSVKDEFIVVDGKAKTKGKERRVFLFEKTIIFSEPMTIEGGMPEFRYMHSMKVNMEVVTFINNIAPYILPFILKIDQKGNFQYFANLRFVSNYFYVHWQSNLNFCTRGVK